jgi:hypothetical protein
MLDEPYAPTLGTLLDFAKRRQYADSIKSKGGMTYILARLDELNMTYCWTPGLRNKSKTNWGQVNRHLWRIHAMYEGGCCFLAGFPNATPHQRIWEYHP